MIRNAARKAERAGADGTLDPSWGHRIERALWEAAELCSLARIDGAVLPVCPEIVGASVEVSGTIPKLLPTEAEHAGDTF